MLSDVIQKPKLKEMIEEEDFQSLYREVDHNTLSFDTLSIMTEEWLDLGVNPLDYMTALPSRYLMGQVKYKSMSIPKNIVEIKYRALSETQGLEEICYQGTVEEFENIKKDPPWMPPRLFGVQCSDGVWLSVKDVSISRTGTVSLGAATTTISGTGCYIGSGKSLPDPGDSSNGDIFLKQVPTGISEFWVFFNDQWQMLSNPSISTTEPTIVSAWGSKLCYIPGAPTITWSGNL